jgi:uncharacterized protein (DUF849 family)
VLQAALNGDRALAEHPATPLTAAELARDAAACVAAGAASIHLHPRDAAGRERLDPEVVDAVVAEVHAACGVPVGVSTGAWIEPGPARRAALARRWRQPAFASVNQSEPGAREVMAALLEAGVGIEAGVWSVEDAERLAASGLAGRVERVLVEPVGGDPPAALEAVAAIHRRLDELAIATPRLQHGDGAATWPLIEDAVRRGLDTRVGLEDTLRDPGGARTAGNAALVAAARRLGA